MAFGLTMGTERATALQKAIEDELMKRQYSTEPGTQYETTQVNRVSLNLSQIL